MTAARMTSLLAGLVCMTAHAAEPARQWETAGFKNPESVIYSEADDLLYVSNVNGDPTQKDGNGFISKVSATGEVMTMEWVTGLDSPKGLALQPGKLYTADVDTVIEIDTASGKITGRFQDPTAKFMNDAAAGPGGVIYVSDSATARIYRLQGGKLEIWMESEALAGINGLFVEADRLLVAAFGDPNANRASRIMAVSFKDKSVTTLSTDPKLGFLDGIEAAGDGGFYLTDWVGGAVQKMDSKGAVQEILPLTQGSADLEFRKDQSELIVPLMMDGKLASFKIQ